MRKLITTFSFVSLLITSSLISYSPSIYANEVNVNVSATFRSAIATTVLEHMNFGTIFFHQSNIDSVTLSPDGKVEYGEKTSGDAHATPASIQIAGQAGTQISISCSSTAAMKGGEHALTIDEIKFMIAGEGTVNTCNGIDTPANAYTISGESNLDRLHIGATLKNTGGNVSETTYSTAEATPITVRLMYM